MQRQWMGLSISGDEVNVELLPSPPGPSAPSYLQSLDLELSFLRRGQEATETYSAEEMTRNFLKAFNGIVAAVDAIMVFEFHGLNLKAVVKALATLELADEQRRGVPVQRSPLHDRMGIIMDKTDITFLKAGDSSIKIKSSSNK